VSMSTTTDIADWCYTECGLTYAPDNIPSEEQLREMHKRSPIARVKDVATPLLMLVGGSDLRVPSSQALDYYHLLKARGCVIRLLHFADGQHPLNDSVLMETNVWLNVVYWLSGRRDGTRPFSV